MYINNQTFKKLIILIGLFMAGCAFKATMDFEKNVTAVPPQVIPVADCGEFHPNHPGEYQIDVEKDGYAIWKNDRFVQFITVPNNPSQFSPFDNAIANDNQ